MQYFWTLNDPYLHYTLGRLEQGDQIVHGVFCKITNNNANIPQFFFIKRITLTMGQILIVLLKLIKKNAKFQSEGQAPKKWGA